MVRRRWPPRDWRGRDRWNGRLRRRDGRRGQTDPQWSRPPVRGPSVSTYSGRYPMCLGIPGRVVDLRDDQGLAMGTVDFGGIRREVCLAYVAGEVKPDDY